MAEPDVIREERDFLLARLTHGDYKWVGCSSDAMVAQALTGAAEPDEWPFDEADMGRCEETYRRAPAHLQARMLPTLERFRRHVAELERSRRRVALLPTREELLGDG